MQQEETWLFLFLILLKMMQSKDERHLQVEDS